MSTKERPSFFILVRVKTPSLGFTIPIPIYVFIITLEAFRELGWLAGKIARGRPGARQGAVRQYLPYVKEALPLLKELLLELRRYGKWRMVEVEAGETRVSVEFF